MRKILIFVDSFLPGYKGGGPITSISNLVCLLDSYFNILICTSDKDHGESDPYKNIVSNKITKYKDFQVVYLSHIDKNSVSKVIKDFNPDLIYLNSFFSKTSQLVLFLNIFFLKKKLVVAPRGELQENALNIKKTKKYIYLYFYKLFSIYRNVSFHSTDAIETRSIAKMFNIDSISQLQNAVKIYKLEPLVKHKNELKCVFVSRISRKKNLHYILTLLSEIRYHVVFDIYGPKEDLSYWKECQDIIDTLPNNIDVSYKGSLPQINIVKTMRKYHAFLFPTLSENFGHVVVEAMQAGLIPIMSDQTPWTNLNYENAGWDISLNDSESYIKAIEELYLMNKKKYTEKSSAVICYIDNKLDMEKLANEYACFFNKIMEV